MVTALDIFERYPLLRTLSLLRSDVVGPACDPTEQQVALFLLWAAVYGRKEYQGIVIDPGYFEFLTEPIGPYLSRLELFAAHIAKRSSSIINDIHAWYYGEAIYDLNLEIFLTPREVNACRDRIARNDRSEPWLSLPRSGGAENIGVNLVGYADGVLGIGEDVRALARIMCYAGLPFAIYNVRLSEHQATLDPSDLKAFYVDRPIFPINIFCTTAFETERLLAELGPNLFSGRYNIGYWPWELSQWPRCWQHVFDSIHEVWAMSYFLGQVYSECTTKPVSYIPSYVNVDHLDPLERRDFNLDRDDFVFLTMLDFNSHIMRKNPVGTIDAFKRAFPNACGQERLVIKTINGHLHPNKLDELLKLVSDDPRIVVMDGPLSRGSTCQLIRDANCFVSLHRAEGFGRVIAEAMFLGTPVIATDYSGSATFLNSTNGFPIPYRLRDVGLDEYTFASGSQWAEPDLDAATDAFRIVGEQGSIVQKRIANARTTIVNNHGRDAVAAKVTERLASLGDWLYPRGKKRGPPALPAQ